MIVSINGATAGRPALLRLSEAQPHPTTTIGVEIGMEWKDQYKHPNWQRRRLEKLQAEDFECESCGEAEIQLHVHHKQYFKARKIWEYSDDELVVLCIDCHDAAHEINDKLKSLLVSQSHHVDRLIGYLHGLSAKHGDPDAEIPVENYEAAEGVADAFSMFDITTESVIELAVKNGRMVTARQLTPEVWEKCDANDPQTNAGKFRGE